MKKTNIILSFVICILSYGCTDLSETVYTGVAMNDFFKNEKELVANAGRIQFRTKFMDTTFTSF